MNLKKLAVVPAALALGTAVALTGCGSSEPSDNATASQTQQASPVEAKELWIKAAKDNMTGAFGTVTNTSDQDLTITGGKSDYADIVEMHETVSDGAGGMQMKRKDEGFTIKPGESKMFEPGGDHIMLMKITKPIEPGEKITITLDSSQGEIPLEFTAKEFSGAQENYAPEGDHSGHEGMDNGDMKHEDMKDNKHNG